MSVSIKYIHHRGSLSYHAGSRKQDGLLAWWTGATDLGGWAVGTSAAFLDMELLAASFDATDDEFGWVVGKKLEGLGDCLKLDDLIVDAAGKGVSRFR